MFEPIIFGNKNANDQITGLDAQGLPIKSINTAEKPMRKIIQICSSGYEDGETLALCNDGTVWQVGRIKDAVWKDQVQIAKPEYGWKPYYTIPQE